MTMLKALLASFALLAATMAVGPSAFAQDIVNIANVRGAQESTYFASVRGWKVVVGAVNGRPAYCATIKDQGGSELRIGYGSEQWQVGIPYSAKRGEFVGSMELDGNVSGTAGVSDGKWTFLWLNLGERDALMNGQQVIFEVGKASMDYELSGTSAAIQKVEECVERRLSGDAVVAGGGGGNQPNTGANPPRFKPVNQPSTGGNAGGVEPYATVGDWNILRQGKGVCEASKLITGNDGVITGLRLTLSNTSSAFGFIAAGYEHLGRSAPLSVWFDNDRASALSFQGKKEKDYNDWDWMMISESNDQPGVLDDSIPNATRISFGFNAQGKNRVASFSLEGTNSVVDKLIDCRNAAGNATAAPTKPIRAPAASPAAAAPGGGFAKTYGKVGGWEIARITKDAGGKRFDHCAAWIITDSETGLRIAITNNDTSFGFSGLGSAAMGNVAPLSVWFDKDKSSASSLEGALVPDHNGFEWMMITESNSEPGLFSDSIPNASTIHFGYPVDGKGHTQTFSLKGTNAVVNKLIDCRDGR